MNEFMPHGFCMRWDFWLLFQHVVSDSLIAIAYFSIPAALVTFVRMRRDVNFGVLFWLFSAFIFSCGMTHLFEIYVLWRPEYWLAGWMKLITAAVSVLTAVMLWRIIPQALKIPSVNQLAAANEELRLELRRRREAELSNIHKDEFLTTLSHELRTPLNAIMGWIHLLKAAEPTPEQVREGMEVIGRNAKAQAQLINDLLDLSGIVAGKIKVDPVPVNVRAVVEAAVSDVKLEARQREITLESELADEHLWISGDAKRLQQIVWNLLNNAVKFTPAGGKVSAVCERTGSEVLVRIVDTGIGIAADFLPYIFDRFRQEDSTTTRTRGGLGIGLSLARELVLLHGGSIEAVSEGKGKGSTFTIRFPLAKPGQQGTKLQLKEDFNEMLQSKRILIVDDDADSRLVVSEVCSYAGGVVDTAESAEAAWELLRRNKPDVILCDLAMPGQDGFNFMGELRRRPELEKVPAIAVSAMARDADRIAALAAGFQEHIAKPIESSELLAAIGRLLKD
jgi:signal transduction histidine kinase/CheY-like chemotaxis protein